MKVINSYNGISDKYMDFSLSVRQSWDFCREVISEERGLSKIVTGFVLGAVSPIICASYYMENKNDRTEFSTNKNSEEFS